MSGAVETQFLFATLLSTDLLPFGWRKLSLVVLPLAWDAKGKARVYSASAAAKEGMPDLAEWLRKVELIWSSRARGGSRVRTPQERLDYEGTLSRQRARGVIKLLYNRSGTHLCSCVIDAEQEAHFKVGGCRVQGFLADNQTYWLETHNMLEAHYLCAVLNAPCVDKAIKPFQTKGAFGALVGRGERDIHRRPFEVLPVPSFRPQIPEHVELAELSLTCHRKVGGMLNDAAEEILDRSTGRLRRMVREALREEIARIDVLTSKVLGI